MSNDCWNEMTVTGSKEDIQSFLQQEFVGLPDWAHTKHVTSETGLQFKLWSSLQPNFQWMEGLLEKYPSLLVKNLWYEQSGTAGVWVGSKEKGIKTLQWDDLPLEEMSSIFQNAFVS
jgi:hypothetical protein